MTPDSSSTPLSTKLGINPQSALALLDVPDGVVIELPDGVSVTRRAGRRADVVVIFVTKHKDLERQIASAEKMIFPAGGLWVAWPKRSSSMVTDLSGDLVRAIALPRGLVDNKICSIDETWSALRVVWRRENRA